MSNDKYTYEYLADSNPQALGEMAERHPETYAKLVKEYQDRVRNQGMKFPDKIDENYLWNFLSGIENRVEGLANAFKPYAYKERTAEKLFEEAGSIYDRMLKLQQDIEQLLNNRKK